MSRRTEATSYEVRRDGYLVSTDPSLLDLDAVHTFLSQQSYWASGISRERFETAVANSMPFGVYRDGRQISFARAISDYATFAYLADVFVVEAHRGRGVSKLLLDAMLKHPQLCSLRRWILGTRDAHSLYAQFGFVPMQDPARWMERPDADAYTRAAPAHG